VHLDDAAKGDMWKLCVFPHFHSSSVSFWIVKVAAWTTCSKYNILSYRMLKLVNCNEQCQCSKVLTVSARSKFTTM
jgi:hypothetical protein